MKRFFVGREFTETCVVENAKTVPIFYLLIRPETERPPTTNQNIHRLIGIH